MINEPLHGRLKYQVQARSWGKRGGGGERHVLEFAQRERQESSIGKVLHYVPLHCMMMIIMQ